MKVIYLHQYFNTPKMSGGTRSYEMARRLVAAGHEVHMVTTWRTETAHDDWFHTTESGIQVHWLPVSYSNSKTYTQRIRAVLSFAIQACRKAVDLKGDLIFATSTPLTIAIPGIYASWRNRLPMVFEVRDLWPELPIAVGALRSPVLKWLARKFERFTYRR
jgi:UDP-N-acetylglucosamine:LPS N-acetylglucosamine transferase